MNLRPLNDHVLVRRDNAEAVTKGGIYVPDNAQTKNRIGVVVGVGPGRFLSTGERREPAVKKGDKVFFRGTAGMEIPYEGQTYVMLREDELDALVTAETTAV